MPPLRHALIALVGVCAVLLASCGSNDGSNADEPAGPPLGSGPFPIADLSIEYSHPDEGVDISYRISCLGDTATLLGTVDGVAGEAACSRLADPTVVRRLVDGPPPDQMCTEQYGGPDLATITGTIDGAVVNTAADRTNGCGISDWDVTLASILPTPLGPTL